ncbi:MAG TPA: MGMT family protein [Pyrinomonadaceae bacterium]|nr:MGMT family protein [Pyrinomonadaceae bacterium]
MDTKSKRTGGEKELKAFTGDPDVVNLPGYNERVFQIVRRIPSGHVMTYGQLAEILGEGYTPRTVGFVMNKADDGVPWHRVINAQGACSTGRILLPVDKQQRMLESEGVEFNARGRCDLGRYRWTPEEARTGDDADDEGAQPSLFGD